jgi:hypothetical protein
MNLYAAETMSEATFSPDNAIPGDFTGLQGLSARFGIGNGRNVEEADRRQACQQERCE